MATKVFKPEKDMKIWDALMIQFKALPREHQQTFVATVAAQMKPIKSVLKISAEAGTLLAVLDYCKRRGYTPDYVRTKKHVKCIFDSRTKRNEVALAMGFGLEAGIE